jgi:hypothetical protein
MVERNPNFSTYSVETKLPSIFRIFGLKTSKLSPIKPNTKINSGDGTGIFIKEDGRHVQMILDGILESIVRDPKFVKEHPSICSPSRNFLEKIMHIKKTTIVTPLQLSS